ncbi:hypothetical protein StoSoilB13_07250 [Arthrobacter sp. StoSoilB13]|nr:hypothetical protein StoSoilB13_07250 [Arthrobacter sp. StoSoilB13]
MLSVGEVDGGEPRLEVGGCTKTEETGSEQEQREGSDHHGCHHQERPDHGSDQTGDEANPASACFRETCQR